MRRGGGEREGIRERERRQRSSLFCVWDQSTKQRGEVNINTERERDGKERNKGKVSLF